MGASGPMQFQCRIRQDTLYIQMQLGITGSCLAALWLLGNLRASGAELCVYCNCTIHSHSSIHSHVHKWMHSFRHGLGSLGLLSIQCLQGFPLLLSLIEGSCFITFYSGQIWFAPLCIDGVLASHLLHCVIMWLFRQKPWEKIIVFISCLIRTVG